jgi:hypothetical protein
LGETFDEAERRRLLFMRWLVGEQHHTRQPRPAVKRPRETS